MERFYSVKKRLICNYSSDYKHHAFCYVNGCRRAFIVEGGVKILVIAGNLWLLLRY